MACTGAAAGADVAPFAMSAFWSRVARISGVAHTSRSLRCMRPFELPSFAAGADVAPFAMSAEDPWSAYVALLAMYASLRITLFRGWRRRASFRCLRKTRGQALSEGRGWTRQRPGEGSFHGWFAQGWRIRRALCDVCVPSNYPLSRLAQTSRLLRCLRFGPGWRRYRVLRDVCGPQA